MTPMVAPDAPGVPNSGEKVAPVQHPAGQIIRATSTTKASLSRQAAAGRVRRLASGLYLSGASLPTENAVRHHALGIAAEFWPGAVICDASALRGADVSGGWLFLCHPDPGRGSDLVLPGLSISVRVGPGALPGDMPMPFGLHMSGTARGLVENVDSRGRPTKAKPARRAGTLAVQAEIDKLARSDGAGRIRNLMAQLDAISDYFPVAATRDVKSWLAAVLGSHDGSTVASPALAARLSGRPFDQHRLDMFARLVNVLERTAPEPRPSLGTDARWQWEPFFEAYFSNFIEGTKFGIEEARSIVIDGHLPTERPKDAHDVAATHRIIADASAADTPQTAARLLEQLKERHGILMAARPEKTPGVFKDRPNFAGGYEFVAPEMVEGTLIRGFENLQPITDPFHRAVSMMLLLTEVHPFADGNGRIARIFANAELSHSGQIRIIIPTVYRNNYLAGLSAVSNGAGSGESLVAVLRFAQRWTGAIDWSTFEVADQQMRETNAYQDPTIAESSGLRLTMPPFS
jgi:hypothetical protein